MHNVQHSAKITEDKAMNLIFDAARANEDREPCGVREGYAVSFTAFGNGTYEAALRDPTGEVVALAIVDSFDF